MLKKHEQLRIHELLEAGCSAPEIAERTGFSIGTIYNYKRRGRQLLGRVPRSTDKEVAALLPYKELIDTYIKRKKIQIKTVLFAVQQAGYTGPNSVVEQYYRQRKQELLPKRYLQHVETNKGEQAQVDWGHFGEIIINGKHEKVYLFAYILAYSRTTYLEFVVRQNQRTLQSCHIHAFETLGMPKTIVYDNMKTVVSRRVKRDDGTEEIYYNVAFMDFARYYQFEILACPPYWPQTKGKIEATIKYVRRYFPRVSPKQSISLEELNVRLANWVNEQAHERVHGTTREKPSQRWLEEKPYLKFPTNIPPYNASPLQTYHTTQYGLLIRNGITYNLGPNYARLKLEVREIQNHGLAHIEIYRYNELISTVQVPTKKHSWVSLERPTTNEKQALPKPADERGSGRKKRAYDIDVEDRDIDYYSFVGSGERSKDG